MKYDTAEMNGILYVWARLSEPTPEGITGTLIGYIKDGQPYWY